MENLYKDWITKARDSVIIPGRAVLLLGDSLEILSGTTLRADTVICDPPYDFDAAGGDSLFGRKNKTYFNDLRDRGLADGFDIQILETASLSDSMVVFFHNDQLSAISGFLSDRYDRSVLCGWKKTNPMPVANKNYVPELELYIHAWRPPAFPQGSIADKMRIIEAPVGKSDWGHPTVKPQRVMRKIVLNASNEGDIILDPFAGSGSTGVAALNFGRRFIGIEKDPDFFRIAAERVSLAAGMTVQPSGMQGRLI